MSKYQSLISRPYPVVINQMIDKIGTSGYVCPYDPNDFTLYGANGIHQATTDKLTINQWVDSYPNCVFGLIPRRSMFIALFQSYDHIKNPDAFLSDKAIESPKIEVDKFPYGSNGSAEFVGRFILMPCQKGDHESIREGIRAGEGELANGGLVVLPHDRGIPIGGQDYFIKGVKMRAEWA